MKKIFTFIGIATLAAALLSSCGKDNVPAVFSDSNAFVAFNSSSLNINEDSKDTLRIKVTLASVAGLDERISYTVKDSTAKQGTNFTLTDASGVLTFDENNRVQVIEVVPKADGLYTGDLIFTITLNASTNVALGEASECVVRIGDVDHPLTPILGEYDMSGDDNWDGPSTWTLTLYKDETDDHMVWFDNIANLGASWYGSPEKRFYGNVDDEMKTVVIPLGQEAAYTYSNGQHMYLRGLNNDGYSVSSGNLVGTFGKNEAGKVTLDFGKEYGVWVTIKDTGNLGIIWPGMTAVKK